MISTDTKTKPMRMLDSVRLEAHACKKNLTLGSDLLLTRGMFLTREALHLSSRNTCRTLPLRVASLHLPLEKTLDRTCAVK